MDGIDLVVMVVLGNGDILLVYLGIVLYVNCRMLVGWV